MAKICLITVQTVSIVRCPESQRREGVSARAAFSFPTLCMNWTELLNPENGGPGESPGREEAVRYALEAVVERKRLKAEIQALKDKKKRRRP